MNEPVAAAPAAGKSHAWLLSLAWPLVCVLGCALWVRHVEIKLDAELAQRPKLAVLPLNQLLLANGTDQAAIEHQAMLARDIAQKLKDAGYIVVDGRQLYAYPKSVEVMP